ACPPGVAFGQPSCTTVLSPSWVTVNGASPDIVLAQTIAGLSNDALYRWRARILQAPPTGTIPGKPAHGPWRRYEVQSTEADIRLPEPGLGASLASGIALLAWLDRRRRPTSRHRLAAIFRSAAASRS